MNRFSENYYLRKCYLETDQVPTQSVMLKTMSPGLAKVYFKSMTPKLKVLAGLEPPLKGGGNDWFVPPEDLLKGKTVLRPIKKELLTKLGFNGLAHYGNSILNNHIESRKDETNKALLENDINWKYTVDEYCKRQYTELSRRAALKNSNKIKDAFREFTLLYTSSINKIEGLLLDGAVEEIKRVKEVIHSKMANKYKRLLKQQATMLYDRYSEKLQKKKEEFKDQFIQNVEQMRTELSNNLHDINLEKHIAIEKLRKLLECQNLACQIYVAMKEKDERKKILEKTEQKHKKVVKLLQEEIERNDVEIEVAKEDERKREQFTRIWQKKVCQVIKHFQEFIAYSLKMVPEQAEFFLNVEKLLLLHLSTAVDNPSVESLFEPVNEGFHTTESEPRPFYLFCDEDFKPQIDKGMCPKSCNSNSSVDNCQLPVIVINKKCIYAACSNLEKFADTIEQFVKSQRETEPDLNDNHDYTYNIPIKYTPSQELLELKGQSSLMQILQKDKPNTKGVPTECLCPCKLPYCFSKQARASTSVANEQRLKEQLLSPILTENNLELSKEIELTHVREPKWESYFEFLEPKPCKCAKVAKKGLQEHLPPYMRIMSAFAYPELPYYEKCSLTTLRKLVRKARSKVTPTVVANLSVSKTKNIGTQYSDQEFEYLCTCFDDKQAIIILNKLLEDVVMLTKTEKEHYIEKSLSRSYLHRVESFVNDRVISLKNLLNECPELVELFNKRHCYF